MSALSTSIQHSNGAGVAHKAALLLVVVQAALGQPSTAPAPSHHARPASGTARADSVVPDVAARGQGAPLANELIELLAAGKTDEAIRQAQAALREQRGDPDARRAYVSLHLALARHWLEAGRVDDAEAALAAVRGVEPDNPTAARVLGELAAARARAPQQLVEVDRLLRLELFEPALDRLREIQALRPAAAAEAKTRELAALRGAADDHYLARNFSEAFALYEDVLARDPQAPPGAHSRWAVALTLAIAESDFARPVEADAAGRLLARAIDVLRRTDEPILGVILGGLLAEQAGEYTDAGRQYAEALGVNWSLPPLPQRRERVRELRTRAVEQARALHRDIPVARRAGFWAVVPEGWKHRQTPHFDVYARNDLVAARVAEAAEHHCAGITAWLGAAPPETWRPRCELRVHATRDELHAATGTSGITFAVSRTRVQGATVLLRKLDVFQTDPWLLSSTLPHELTHLILAAWPTRLALPLAVEEGLSLQAEPPARRLMYRRLLGRATAPPDLDKLPVVAQAPADVERFYAEAGALTAWLLDRVSAAGPPRHNATAQPRTSPAASGPAQAAAAGPSGAPARVLAEFGAGWPDRWWRPLGFESDAAALADWAWWCAARGKPPRLPLMILVEPAAEHRKPAEHRKDAP
ncbi:MAG: tetratricopeptide repeat protein [Planctomycetota bacterium]